MTTAFDAADTAERLWFANLIRYLCLTYGGSETSGIRSPAHNKAVGGDPASLHLSGLARDVIFDTPKQREAAIAEAVSRSLHFLLEIDHVHFQSRPAKPK